MIYGRLTGINKPISRLVLGVDHQKDLEQAAPQFDRFVELGGTVFDNAWIYGSGVCETVFGAWAESRDIRDDIQVIIKGAHTPHCTPEALSQQLVESLERQRNPYADLYLMHRDNPEVPVGEFVEVLNQHFKAGQIRAFGGSNWSLERLQEAQAYAAKHDLEPFRAVSNQLSLAQMMEPPWAGCLGVEQNLKTWLSQTQIALFPWSSQARGFFIRGDPADLSDPELVRCWYSQGNFERLARAKQLAQEMEVEVVQVALAYVLHQPFPTFALIGPRTVQELESSIRGLEVGLSADQVAWLEGSTNHG